MRSPLGPLMGRVVSEHEGEHVSNEVVAVVRIRLVGVLLMYM